MPTAEHVTPIADDIFQVRLPLPFALNSVNVYLLRGDDGWTLIDTGLNTPEAQGAWESAFKTIGITTHDIRQIILTHVHPDHYGIAGWFQAQAVNGSVPTVYMSAREAELARLVWGGQGQLSGNFNPYLIICGMPADMIDTVSTSLKHTIDMTRPHPTHTATLNTGESMTIGRRTFDIILAPGHSDGQLIFYDPADRLMLSGDHVLMKITPNIGRWPDTNPDPLGQYLDSLRGLHSLDVRLALPGHKSLITDWSGRIAELLHHHDQRLEHTLAAIQGGATVYEASLKVFDSSKFSPHEWRFAMVETLAHLEYLEQRGKVKRASEDDVWRFDPTS